MGGWTPDRMRWKTGMSFATSGCYFGRNLSNEQWQRLFSRSPKKSDFRIHLKFLMAIQSPLMVIDGYDGGW